MYAATAKRLPANRRERNDEHDQSSSRVTRQLGKEVRATTRRISLFEAIALANQGLVPFFLEGQHTGEARAAVRLYLEVGNDFKFNDIETLEKREANKAVVVRAFGLDREPEFTFHGTRIAHILQS